MNRKQFLLTLLLAVISGSLGGALSVWFLMPPSVLAQDGPQKVIEAQEFRVVDEEGRMRATLGFSDSKSTKETHLLFLDKKGVERIQLRNYEEDSLGDLVIIAIQESRTGPAASLSVTPVPQFRMRHKHGGAGGLGGGEIILSLSNEGIPSINLLDQDHNPRAVLGTTQLKHPDTGSTEIRAPSSLVLFDEEGKVVWSAP